jgi:hypothetical protein
MALLRRDFLGGFANGEEGLRNDAIENRSVSKRKVSDLQGGYGTD